MSNDEFEEISIESTPEEEAIIEENVRTATEILREQQQAEPTTQEIDDTFARVASMLSDQQRSRLINPRTAEDREEADRRARMAEQHHEPDEPEEFEVTESPATDNPIINTVEEGHVNWAEFTNRSQPGWDAVRAYAQAGTPSHPTPRFTPDFADIVLIATVLQRINNLSISDYMQHFNSSQGTARGGTLVREFDRLTTSPHANFTGLNLLECGIYTQYIIVNSIMNYCEYFPDAPPSHFVDNLSAAPVTDELNTYPMHLNAYRSLGVSLEEPPKKKEDDNDWDIICKTLRDFNVYCYKHDRAIGRGTFGSSWRDYLASEEAKNIIPLNTKQRKLMIATNLRYLIMYSMPSYQMEESIFFLDDFKELHYRDYMLFTYAAYVRGDTWFVCSEYQHEFNLKFTANFLPAFMRINKIGDNLKQYNAEAMLNLVGFISGSKMLYNNELAGALLDTVMFRKELADRVAKVIEDYIPGSPKFDGQLVHYAIDLSNMTRYWCGDVLARLRHPVGWAKVEPEYFPETDTYKFPDPNLDQLKILDDHILDTLKLIRKYPRAISLPLTRKVNQGFMGLYRYLNLMEHEDSEDRYDSLFRQVFKIKASEPVTEFTMFNCLKTYYKPRVDETDLKRLFDYSGMDSFDHRFMKSATHDYLLTIQKEERDYVSNDFLALGSKFMADLVGRFLDAEPIDPKELSKFKVRELKNLKRTALYTDLLKGLEQSVKDRMVRTNRSFWGSHFREDMFATRYFLHTPITPMDTIVTTNEMDFSNKVESVKEVTENRRKLLENYEGPIVGNILEVLKDLRGSRVPRIRKGDRLKKIFKAIATAFERQGMFVVKDEIQYKHLYTSFYVQSIVYVPFFFVAPIAERLYEFTKLVGNCTYMVPYPGFYLITTRIDNLLHDEIRTSNTIESYYTFGEMVPTMQHGGTCMGGYQYGVVNAPDMARIFQAHQVGSYNMSPFRSFPDTTDGSVAAFDSYRAPVSYLDKVSTLLRVMRKHRLISSLDDSFIYYESPSASRGTFDHEARSLAFARESNRQAADSIRVDIKYQGLTLGKTR